MVRKHKFQILDLGMHPFADTFINENQLIKSEPIFPLKCELDTRTGLISSMIKTDVYERYNLYEYSYTSSNSKFLRDYWTNLSKKLIKSLKINKKTKILEIGSNDGYLLSKFKKKTKNLVAVDASIFMTKITKKKKIKSLNLIFDNKSANKIKNKFGLFDLVIANNVVHHSSNPDNFIKGIKKILNKNATFIFEVPYWLTMVKNKNFDQVYHEHTTHFNVKSLNFLCSKNNLEIRHIEFTKNHGSSLRVFSKFSNKPKINKQSIKLIKNENKHKIYSPKTYKIIEKELHKRKLNFLIKLIKFKLKGYKIIGIGAAAKANTFINLLGLNKFLIDYVTDVSEYKIGKYTPLSRIPIYKDEKIKSAGDKVIAIAMAWNIGRMLKNKILKINNKVKFLNI